MHNLIVYVSIVNVLVRVKPNICNGQIIDIHIWTMSNTHQKYRHHTTAVFDFSRKAKKNLNHIHKSRKKNPISQPKSLCESPVCKSVSKCVRVCVYAPVNEMDFDSVFSNVINFHHNQAKSARFKLNIILFHFAFNINAVQQH